MPQNILNLKRFKDLHNWFKKTIGKKKQPKRKYYKKGKKRLR